MDPLALREATRAEHERVESTLHLMDDDLTTSRYVAYLRRFYGVVAAWEQYAAEHAPASLRAFVAKRQRAPMLAADLAHFSEALPTDRAAIPQFADEASFLGAMYVMEGSTLGGQFIARHVESVLKLEPGAGNCYFIGYGNSTGAMWHTFKDHIAQIKDEQSKEVISAAQQMFLTFEQWMSVSNS